MAASDDRRVTIDIETATETATRPEDIARIRREAGIEEGTPPSRRNDERPPARD
ncbi:MAG: hypothetical protein JWO69_1569 [Thermoleophilia bacterium]|jgi:hypothetical protein|nr:hypothetical protein [Thermoleophilia bacterium]